MYACWDCSVTVTCQLSEVTVITIKGGFFNLTYVMFFCSNYKKMMVVTSMKIALYKLGKTVIERDNI